MRQRLILLSDLWGVEKAEWIDYYVEELQDRFDVCYYDCCQLGNVDKTNYSENALHTQFINGGIDKAVDSLLELEPTSVVVIGFSIGGLIGWKAALKGMNTLKLHAISSTRLRYEIDKPEIDIELYFGELDPNRPSQEWFDVMQLKNRLEMTESHLFYSKPRFAQELTRILNEDN